MIVSVVRYDGILALYNGLTASVLRQVGKYDILYYLTVLCIIIVDLFRSKVWCV